MKNSQKLSVIILIIFSGLEPNLFLLKTVMLIPQTLRVDLRPYLALEAKYPIQAARCFCPSGKTGNATLS